MPDDGSDSGLYTVLVFVAVMALLCGVIVLLVRHASVFGGNPFSPEASAAVDAVRSIVGV